MTILTRKFGLGAENIIARIAISYSFHSGIKLSPLDTKDSGGKEYSKNVLFGSLFPVYLALLCTHYGISETDRDSPRLFKLHLDHGLMLMECDLKDNPNLVGFDYLFDKIQIGLNEIC